MFTKNACSIFHRLYWLCCHRAFSFASHSGDKILRRKPFVCWWLEFIGSKGHHCHPGESKNDTWMAASCKGGIWSDTDMLHYQCNVCSTEVTSPTLIQALILPASPLPNARAVCHGWFGNKMRKVLSQRQKSPFHLALCHPFPLSHAHERARTSALPRTLCQNPLHKNAACLDLFLSRVQDYTQSMQAAQSVQRCTGVVSTTATVPSPSLSFVLLPNILDTRCFVFPCEKLAPKTFCGADYSTHKSAVKHFYKAELWCVTCYAVYWCLCQTLKYVLILKITVLYNPLCIYHNSHDWAGSNDSASQIIGLMKCKKESVRVPFLHQIHITLPYCSYRRWMTERRSW